MGDVDRCFADADVDRVFGLDGWVRNRLRYCIWTDWKKQERNRRHSERSGLRMEQNANRWMGSYAKPYIRNHDHRGTAYQTRLPIHVLLL